MVIADPLYKWAMTPLRAKQRQQERPLDGGAVEEDPTSTAGLTGDQTAERTSLVSEKQRVDKCGAFHWAYCVMLLWDNKHSIGPIV